MSEVDRSRIEQDFKGLLLDKEAETARLRAEIGRLRRALDLAQGSQESHGQELKALQLQVQQVATLNKAHERHAVLSAATSASGSPRAESVRLQADLDGQVALVARQEAELSSHLAATAARISELQDSFAAKVQGMRQVQQQQLALVEKEAKQRETVLKAEADSLRQQLESKAAESAQLRGQLGDQVHAAASASESKLSQEQQRGRQLDAKVKALEQQLAKVTAESRAAAEAAAAGAAARLPPPAESGVGGGEGEGGGRGGAGGVDQAGMAEMLAMMEGQLGRLSEMIRLRDTEVKALRATVQAGCDERRDLQQQLNKALQAPLPLPPPPGSDGYATLAGDFKPLPRPPMSKKKFR